jgi:hypothetical protein
MHRAIVIALAAAATATLIAGPLAAQDKPPLRTDVAPAIAERMLKEGELREACKKAICQAAKAKTAEGDPITCKVVKTWAAPDLKERILKGKLAWTLGHALCTADLKIDRGLIAKALGDAKYEGRVGKHAVSCVLEAEDGKESHKLSFSIDPVVTFEGGKATKAVLTWSDVDGTTLAKSALWSATTVDNTFNVLQSIVTEQINEFFGPKCAEVLK